jgi:hypothetical protein
MPGTETLGKLFFKLFFERFGSQNSLQPKSKQTRQTPWNRSVYRLKASPSRACLRGGALVVRRIIRRKRLRRRGEFVARLRHKVAAAPTRSEFVLTFRTGRDDHSAAGGRTENQSSIRRDANNPGAHRTSGTSPSVVS